MVSLQCLWIYDYLLTFGDEVRCPPLLPKGTSDADRRAGKLCLVWAEIMGYVYLLRLNFYNLYGRCAVFALFIAV